jgi:hypothetical protein
MKRSLFWGLHLSLINLINRQTISLINNNDELYEQYRLDILETIKILQSELIPINHEEIINLNLLF